MLISACGDVADEGPALAGAPSAMLPDRPAAAAGCVPGGRFETRLYGPLDGAIDWSGGALSCGGMPRPEDRGARLRFAGSADGIELAFIISVPDLEPGRVVAELPSNVTLIEEGDGRFFSTSDLDGCWTDLEVNERAGETGNRYRVVGTVYCIAPLAEVNGSASVTIEEAHFSGYVDWEGE